MHYQDTLVYNQRWMTELVARKYVMGRHRLPAGASTMSRAWMTNPPKVYPRASMDRYDHAEDRAYRRENAADMAALRYGVSTREQRERLANRPIVHRGYRTGTRSLMLNAEAVCAILNKAAGEKVFCCSEASARFRHSINDVSLALVEDMRTLYDGTHCFQHSTMEVPAFPGMLFNRHDRTMVDIVTDVARGRYVTCRVPRKLAEMQGARALSSIIAEREGQRIAQQLMDRISVSRDGSVTNAYVMPAVLSGHARLFTAEFLRINHGRRPGEYHSSARYLRGEAEGQAATLGLEWEIGVPSTRRTIITNRVLNAFSKAAGTMDYIHAERDGSLNNRGVEFVFAYRTLDKHSQIINDAFDGDETLPNRNQTLAPRLEAISNGGIHVHIGTSRADGTAIDASVFARMHNVLNLPANYGFITAVAGRGGGHYVRYDHDTLLDPSSGRGALSHLSTSRYKVLNWRGNTVEIRMFKTDKTRQWLLTCLEFADALLQYCSNNHGLTLRAHANAHNFNEWVLNCVDCYPNLAAHLQSEAVVTALMEVAVPAGEPPVYEAFALPANPRMGTPGLPPRRTLADVEEDFITSLRTGGTLTGNIVPAPLPEGVTAITVDELLEGLEAVPMAPVRPRRARVA